MISVLFSIYNEPIHWLSKSISFEVVDICSDRLCDSDLIIVRDCLIHFSYEDINNFLQNLSNVNYKMLMTTTHIVDQNFINTDLQTGGFRQIDLFKKPFCFDESKVIARVKDHDDCSKPKEMILLKKQFVPTRLSQFV